MKTTLVLCVLALAVALVFGSGGDHGGHGGGSHGEAHAADGSHGAGDDHSGSHGGDHGSGDHGSSATSLQLCSTLFSFVVLAALNKLR